MHIVSFSGGKDSTAMLLLMLEKNWVIDEIIYCDTGMEFPAMYEHIQKVENYINRPITVLRTKYNFEYMMSEHKKRNGKIGYGWPDFKNRWCTSYFKKDTIRRYLKKYNNTIEYHGIAIDEAHRADKNKEKVIRYPLIEWGMTEKDALNYCYKLGFDWNGLYKHYSRASCWCCPLQSLKDLKALYQFYPSLWTKLKELDKKAFNYFRLDYSLEELEIKFKGQIWLEENQLKLWEV